jgi:hypothetical protein
VGSEMCIRDSTCTVAHTQQADRKPGQGANWQSFWTEYVYDPTILAAGDGEEQARQQELWAAEAGETFLDVRDVFGNYIEAFTNGLISDFVHPTFAGWEALASALNTRLNLASIPLGGIAVGGPYSLGYVGGVDGVVQLNAPLRITGQTGGASAALEIQDISAGAGEDSRKVFSVQVNNNNTVFSYQYSGLCQLGFSFNGPGQHALTPHNNNTFTSLGGPSSRWRGFFSGVSSNTRTISANTTLDTFTDHTVYCNAATAAFTVTLPAASAVTGRLFVIKKIDNNSSNAITIAVTGGGTVDGVTNPTLTAQWQVLRVRSDGATYFAE